MADLLKMDWVWKKKIIWQMIAKLQKITFHSDFLKRGLLTVAPCLILFTIAGVVGQENSLGSHGQSPTTNSKELSPLLHAYLSKRSHFSWRNCLVAEEKKCFILMKKARQSQKSKGQFVTTARMWDFLEIFEAIISGVNLRSIMCIQAHYVTRCLYYYFKWFWFEGKFLLSSSEV